MIKNVCRSSCKVPARYSCQVLMKLDLSWTDFRIIKTSNFVKICSVGAELFHEDRQTDRQKDEQT
jgi:hypothetical protein